MLTLAVDRRSVTGMLNLGDILELVNNSLNDRAFSEQQAMPTAGYTYAQGHEAIFHVTFEFGDQLYPNTLE
jgi:hypothetical protein